jgi:hypothetical protein
LRKLEAKPQAWLNSIEEFIGCDGHKKFSVFVTVNEKGNAGGAQRVPHERQLVREFLARLPAHSTIAVEACGHYSWLVDEMEQLGSWLDPWKYLRVSERFSDPETSRLEFGGFRCDGELR